MTLIHHYFYLAIALFVVSFGLALIIRDRLNNLNIGLLFAGALAVYACEYFILGPYSYISTYSDSYMSTYALAAARHGFSGLFNHAIAGGQDIAQTFHVLQFWQPEAWFFYLPPWLGLALHKTMIFTIAFIGFYGLVVKCYGGSLTTAVCLTFVFMFSSAFIVDYTVEFGTGFSAVPLGCYILLRTPKSRLNDLLWIAFTIAVFAASQPTKMLPTFAASALALLLFSPRLPVRRVLILFAVFISISLANWSEFIFALTQILSETTRSRGLAEQPYEFIANLDVFVTGLQGRGAYADIIFLGAVFTMSLKRAWDIRALAPFIAFIAMVGLAHLIPWTLIGLSIIQRIDHNYMWLGAIVPLVPAVCAASTRAADGVVRHEAVLLRPLMLTLALVSLLEWKVIHATYMISFGGSAHHFGYQDLQAKPWYDGEGRAVTLGDTPMPTITAAYFNIDAFDGTMMFNNVRWNNYWRAIKRVELNGSRIATRPEINWQNWDGAQYHIDNDLDLDLLRFSNVEYIISPVPLTGDGLTIVSAPADGATLRLGSSTFPSYADFLRYRMARFLHVGKHFVYRLNDTLPRAYWAKGIQVSNFDDNTDPFYRDLKSLVPSRIAVFAKDDPAPSIAQISASESTDAALKVASVPNGYIVTLSEKSTGLLIINQMFSRFWMACSGGEALDLFAVNGVQMAAEVTSETPQVYFRYARPTLFKDAENSACTLDVKSSKK